MPTLLPFCAKQIMNRENKVLSIFCWNIIHKIENAKHTALNQDIKLSVEVTQKIAEIDKLIEDGYGGEVPKIDIPDALDGNNDFSPEVLLELFQEFSAGR